MNGDPNLPQFGGSAPAQPGYNTNATPVNPGGVPVVEPNTLGAQSGLVLQPVGGGIEHHWERERMNQL